MDVEAIKKQAQKELVDEEYRKAVDAYKLKLKNKQSFWDRVFPYRLIIIKKEK